MANSPTAPKSWFKDAAKLVARNNLSLRAAAQEFDVALTLEEADRISKQKAWQDALWKARNEYATEVASTPGTTKTALLGQMYLAVTELFKAGEWDKGIVGCKQIAQLQGWEKSNEINIFAGITTADIEAQKKAIEKEIFEHQSNKPASSSKSN